MIILDGKTFEREYFPHFVGLCQAYQDDGVNGGHWVPEELDGVVLDFIFEDLH